MKPIPMLGLGVQSGFPAATAQSRINCYLEQVTDTEKSVINAYRTPGLELFSGALGDTPIRGKFEFGDYTYIVHRNTFYKVNNAATMIPLGTISTTSGRVWMEGNGQQILLVDGTDTGYIYEISEDTTVTITIASPAVISWTAHGFLVDEKVRFTTTGALPTGITAGTDYFIKEVVDVDSFKISATAGGAAINTSGSQSGVHTGISLLSTITDTDYPGLSSAVFINGWFVGHVAGTGNFYVSALRNGMSWNALDFANAESSPDNVEGLFVDRGYLIVFNAFTTEVWGVTGAADFPLSKVGAGHEWGLIGADSIAKLGESIAFLARNRLGQVQVVMMQGGLVPISTHDVDRILNDYGDVSAATAWSYMNNGHHTYVLNVSGQTWMYDLQTSCWSQLISDGETRHRAEIGGSFVNKTLVTDFESGNLYRLKDDVYTDNGAPIRMEITGKHITNNREYMTIDSIQIDLEQGVGLTLGQGCNPQMMLSLSKDQGHTFGVERWKSLGKKGKYDKRTIWWQLGLARDFVVKIAISDPVPVCITGVYGNFR